MRITINFKKEHEKDFLYAENQSNTSEYIRSLIKKDRLNEGSVSESKVSKLIESVEKLLKGNIEIKDKDISEFKKKALNNMFN